MTNFEIAQFDFHHPDSFAEVHDDRLSNWPVVYVLNSDGSANQRRGQIYFGETLSFGSRMRQHLESPEKQGLQTIRVILDETFNKSVCLDLESQLIKYAAGDGQFEVLNRNDGVVDANYFDRSRYQPVFDAIFYELRDRGLFTRTIPEIVNSELFKLSPFKALNHDQAAAVEDILEGLSEDLQDASNPKSVSVVQGDPGTGKTIVAIYLMKLMVDISQQRDEEDLDRDTMFSDFFLPGFREAFQGLRIGLVVPQQSLRKSISNVFAKTPGLSKSMVLSTFEAAEASETFDVLIVDEAHRLSQFAAQAHGTLTAKYRAINEQLFEGTKPQASQLDWLREKSKHLILLFDSGQSVRPGDISKDEFEALLEELHGAGRKPYRLRTQMRAQGGNDYVDYVQAVLSNHPPAPQMQFGDYEIGIVDDPAKLNAMIRQKNAEHGLSRILAGYAWPWISKKNKQAYDIDLGEGAQFQWNTRETDWVNSRTSLQEAGSIHTIQGYDLNYAGVIIGNDLQFDVEAQELVISRRDYHDKKGKANNVMGGTVTTDEDLFKFITNVYSVLMTRGIKGTFLHVVNPELRSYLKFFFPVID